ncbi:MAG: MATE family efflux transporter [Treponema sp.]|jgi:putative MATE family efflux protein|nr:MATE family efflux transporter [Treponema sp.]
MKINKDGSGTFSAGFRRSLIALVIPIAFQNLISAAVNSADIVMLSNVGQSVMSAVSLAGQITFVLMLFYAGLAIGTGILTAQYWGKNNTMAIKRVLSIACIFSVIVSFLFFIASIVFPDSLMHIFTNDEELIMYGVKYQRSLSFSYLAMSLSQMYLAMVKSMEKTHFSAIVSSAGLILNILLNALCIFVLFKGDPEMTIIGVAAATVIARFFELACCFIHSLHSGNVRFSLPIRDNVQKLLLHDYLRYTIPVLANYVVYGGALAASIAIIGHVSSDMVAANAIINVVKNLATVLCNGIGVGGSILVGKYLGSQDIQFAKKAGIKIYKYALGFGVLAGITILAMKPLIFILVNINIIAQGYLNLMLFVCAFWSIGKSLNSTIIGGIFPAGGDAKFGFLCDVIVMWGIIIPLSLVCAFIWHVQPVILYIVICSDEFIKMPVALIRFRQYRWLNNITRDFK